MSYPSPRQPGSLGGAPMRIVLAGVDGSGKSTAARALADAFAARGIESELLAAPGGRRRLDTLARRAGTTAIRVLGARGLSLLEAGVRAANLLRGERRLASRARPPAVVVHDRHAVCQLALDAARGVATPRWFSRLADRLPPADLVVYLDVPPALAAERVRRRGTDVETEADLAAFDAAYRSLGAFPGFLRVDASGTEEEAAARVLAAVDGALGAAVSGSPAREPRGGRALS
ncbi:AAA family ATPase [Sinomonas mesophila]|uniref:AAA family ATPase n=1 Tax=Sinomonas mesophila TaxID=1531955 RepID=UPI0009875C11|nr:AAA family ATPase [Sinomonas mesophila]